MSHQAEYEGVEIIPVRQAHQLDEAALERYLAARIEAFRGPMVVRQFEGGQSNPTYFLEAGGRAYVMRKKPPGKLLPSAHAVEREYRVITALRDTPVPVPETYLLCDDEDIVGTPFFVMSHVPGRLMVDPRLDTMPKTERMALLMHFVECLAALHAVDHEAVGLGDFGRPGNYYRRQYDRWAKQYGASETESIPAMDRLIEWLPDNIPETDETTLVHGDYRIGNCLVHPSEPRVVAVLDWELSTLGHPLADLAYTSMVYHVDTGRTGNFLETDFEATGIPTEEELVGRYCALTGRGEIENWPFYVVFAIFRIAAIVQGVYKRGLDGISASAQSIEFKDVCRLRAEQAWRMVERM